MSDSGQAPLISTTVLSWNRRELLQITLESYRDTIAYPFELFVVDNGSTDGSRELAAEFCSGVPSARAILLESNYGGISMNIGIEASRGRFIHLSENDVEYLPGWSERVVGLFDSVDDLGQLSLYGPVPTDDEICEHAVPIPWETHGELIYEVPSTVDNVPLTSVIRRDVFDTGARSATVGDGGPDNPTLLPNDGYISTQVKNRGYRIAWADHYMVRNLGDSLSEFEQRHDYYEANYAAKTWVGVDEWQARIERWRRQARPDRRLVAFPDHPVLAGETISPEATEPSPHCAAPRDWSMFDALTPEIEVLEFVYGLVRTAKPAQSLIARAWSGHLAAVVAEALSANGLGAAVALEGDPDSYARLVSRLSLVEKCRVEPRNIPLAAFVPEGTLDMVLLECRDAGHDVGSALVKLSPHICDGTMVVLLSSDKANTDPPLSVVVDLFESRSLASVIRLDTPRGLTLMRWRAGPNVG